MGRMAFEAPSDFGGDGDVENVLIEEEPEEIPTSEDNTY